MRRAQLIGLIAIAAVLFLVISALLARALSVSGAEQAAVTRLIDDEARGDTAAVVSLPHPRGRAHGGAAPSGDGHDRAADDLHQLLARADDRHRSRGVDRRSLAAAGAVHPGPSQR
jgi:hypothetical protein